MKRFVVYSQDDLDFFDTIEEAKSHAERLIDLHLDDEWDEAVGQIFIAELKYTTHQTNVVTPDMFEDGSRELNGKFYEGDPDYWCDYELKEFEA